MANDAGGLTVRHDPRPGDLGRVITQHGVLYAREYGFGLGFEAYVAETLADFGRLPRPGLDRLWLAERGGRLVGSIAILGREGAGQGTAGKEGDGQRAAMQEGDGQRAAMQEGEGQGGGVAQLRWFLVEPSERGAGLGRRLVGEALAFCRAAGYRSVYLWTVGGLDAAAHLYVAHGFRKTETRPPARLWGADLSEERYNLTLRGKFSGPGGIRTLP